MSGSGQIVADALRHEEEDRVAQMLKPSPLEDMNMNGLEAVLATHDFTKGMKSNHLRKLADCASYVEIPAAEYILRQGEPAKSFYLILDGSAEVELFSATGGPVVLQRLSAGSALGWSWLVPPCRSRFDVRVVQPVKALRVDASQLQVLMEEDPAFGYEILRRIVQLIGQRLESERMSLMEFYAAHS